MEKKFHDGAEIRRLRKLELLNIVENNPNETEQKIMNVFMLKTGLTSKTARNYLVELMDGGLMERREGKLRLIR